MAYVTLDLRNFAEIDQSLGASRSLPLALNTVAYRTGDNKSEIAISYHGNDIAIYDTGNKSITLTTSGWVSPTTVDRLDQIARGNGIGTVSTVGGRVRFTHRAKDHGWYHLEDAITVDRNGKVEHKDPDRHYGYSNSDTYQAAGLASNPLRGESEHNAILNMSRHQLRQWIKNNREEIGYSAIDNVNVREVYYTLNEEN